MKTKEDVIEFLSNRPCARHSYGQNFAPFTMVRKKTGYEPLAGLPHLSGVTVKFEQFTVSVQGSKNHYCKPRETLDKLTDYDSVEVAFWVGKETFERGWKRPSELGFVKVEDNRYEDDVQGWVLFDYLVEDLVMLFNAGWTVKED